MRDCAVNRDMRSCLCVAAAIFAGVRVLHCSHVVDAHVVQRMMLIPMMIAGPAISTAPEDLVAALSEGGYETLEVAQRVELLVYLCEDASETPGINKHLDAAIEETRELSNEMKEEEKKLREQKKQAKLDKAKGKEQAQNNGTTKADEDEKPKVRLLPGTLRQMRLLHRSAWRVRHDDA